MACRQLAFLGACAMDDIRPSPDGETSAHYAYFVTLSTAEDEQADGQTTALLRDLLSASVSYPTDFNNTAALIIPRIGMVSPWSSKASDILRRCGIKNLQRVERGILIRNAEKHTAYIEAGKIHDRMTQRISDNPEDWQRLINETPESQQNELLQGSDIATTIQTSNLSLGLAMNPQEIEHLKTLYTRLDRFPTAAELMMFAQANSEHCRHKIFNASWTDGKPSLMAAIRQTHEDSPAGVVVAFSDNAAIVEGSGGASFSPNADDIYQEIPTSNHLVVKAETHNHPTAISPFAGAATGNGGEIRDEAAAGRGAVSRVGFCGFAVSNLSLSQCGDMPAAATPAHIASAQKIMIEAPIGAADYNNEFGRPTIGGFFRCYEAQLGDKHLGFHKPLMLAGGLGHILPHSAAKQDIPPGAKIIQLGGPGFRIGMGGGGASSRSGGDTALDFNSVQRGNAEMQRRTQEVIETYRHKNNGGDILSIHDVGAGGLANAVIELVFQSQRGARIDLAAIPVEDTSLTAAEIWCNESQERYVLALPSAAVKNFTNICERECCPFAVIGEATEELNIIVTDKNATCVVNLPLDEVLGDIAKQQLEAKESPAVIAKIPAAVATDITAAAYAVLRHPSVACKRFLINIGDRNVGGLTAREQMVGPWQTPVADCATFFNDYESAAGFAFALGERAALAALAPAAASRMAIAEALTNLSAADIGDLCHVKFSLNWLANSPADNGILREAVYAAADFCRALGVGVVVGKDSLSMKTPIDKDTAVESPAFAVATAVAPTNDAGSVLTPQLSGQDDTILMLATTGDDRRRLGASIFSPTGGETPDVSAESLRALWQALAQCRQEKMLLSCHDRSDGGLWTTACEMAFAANCGLSLTADALCSPASETDGGEMVKDLLAIGGQQKLAAVLFNEEVGVLLEVKRDDAPRVLQIFAAAGLAKAVQTIGYPLNLERRVRVYLCGQEIINETLSELRQAWDETSYEICRRRDTPACAKAEHERDYDNDPGLFAQPPKDWQPTAPAIIGTRPQVAILREQGINGQREMAAAFHYAGFDAVDIHISDLLTECRSLDKNFQGIAFAGGFSFGDVLGAGRGLACGILRNEHLAEMFKKFFARDNAFVLGVCNGCQALSLLQPLMPQAENWQFPRFLPNQSKRYEARLAMVKIMENTSPLLANMSHSLLPIVVSHGEGLAVFDDTNKTQAPLLMSFTDNHGKPTEAYPYNPNGSAEGKTGFCSPDGRIVLMMPHPERVFRVSQLSWRPPTWKEGMSPWHKIFTNARRFIA